MLQIYKVDTKQSKISKNAEQVSQDPSAEGFIVGLNEHRIEYSQSLFIFEENHKRIFKKIKNVAKDYIILCIEERWGLGPLETNFGYASLEPLLGGGEVFWCCWTTIAMQRSLYPSLNDEEVFKKGLAKYIGEFEYQTSSHTPILVSDQHNLQRCLNLVKELGLEFKLTS